MIETLDKLIEKGYAKTTSDSYTKLVGSMCFLATEKNGTYTLVLIVKTGDEAEDFEVLGTEEFSNKEEILSVENDLLAHFVSYIYTESMKDVDIDLEGQE